MNCESLRALKGTAVSKPARGHEEVQGEICSQLELHCSCVMLLKPIEAHCRQVNNIVTLQAMTKYHRSALVYTTHLLGVGYKFSCWLQCPVSRFQGLVHSWAVLASAFFVMHHSCSAAC